MNIRIKKNLPGKIHHGGRHQNGKNLSRKDQLFDISRREFEPAKEITFAAEVELKLMMMATKLRIVKSNEGGGVAQRAS